MNYRMKLLTLMVIFAVYTLQAQDVSLEEYIKTKAPEADEVDGFYFLEEQEGKGDFPKRGDYVMVNFKGTLLDGTVFDASEPDQPFVFQLGYRQVIRGWERGMLLLKVGGKGQLLLPPDLAYGKVGAGTKVPPNSPVIFQVELLKILNEAQYDEYMIELEKKEREAFLKRKKEQFSQDKKDIHYYCAENKIKAKALPSGVSYAITKKGKGANAKDGDKLTVAYEGFLVDGRKFDASDKKKPLSFELGKRKVIEGWEKGLKHFNEGAEGWIIVPSQLAYGPRGIKEDSIDIPPNSVLAFKVKVRKIN